MSCMFTIREGLEIADRWREIRTSRSGGPGGQHVNKVSSRVELRLDLRGCDDLSPRVKSRLRALAGQRITKDGVLRFVCTCEEASACKDCHTPHKIYPPKKK